MKVRAVTWKKRLEAWGIVCPGPPWLQDSSKTTPWELLPVAKGSRSEGGDGKPSHGAVTSQDPPRRRDGWGILAIDLPDACFLPHEQAVGWTHRLAHGYGLCRTYCLHKCQLFGTCEKFVQAPLEDAVWSHVDASSSCHGIFKRYLWFLALSELEKKSHFGHDGHMSRKSSHVSTMVLWICSKHWYRFAVKQKEQTTRAFGSRSSSFRYWL